MIVVCSDYQYHTCGFMVVWYGLLYAMILHGKVAPVDDDGNDQGDVDQHRLL